MNQQEAGAAAAGADHIDPHDEAQLHEWARRLDASPEQIREAVAAVGNHPDDVEMHLKGSRSSTNSERVSDLS